MRLLELAVFVAFLGGCGALGRAVWNRLGAARAQAEDWEPFHRFEGSCRRVYVRRAGELEPVGSIAADDPDYDDAFLRLMERARERAAMLNSER